MNELPKNTGLFLFVKRRYTIVPIPAPNSAAAGKDERSAVVRLHSRHQHGDEQGSRHDGDHLLKSEQKRFAYGRFGFNAVNKFHILLLGV
ncbi:MAG: hypothetical protein ACLRTQ_09455 [Candidatus Borkfalkia sp.]